MINAGCFSLKEPLTTQFLLIEGNHLCPRFYGKVEDKKKVYYALKETIHPQVHDHWGQLKCHCSQIPIIRLSKTARNLTKFFLTCEAPATATVRCKYFQWVHTALFIDKRPVHKLKYATKLSQAEWIRQAEANVEKWKQQQAWFNQFAESAKKQEEQRQATSSNPWKKPSTFYWSPEIAQAYRKTDEWK